MIISSSEHAFFSWTYKTYKLILSVDTYDIIMATQNIILFERLTKDFDTLFDFNFKEGSKLKLLSITMI